jgi:hypothetical protein
VAYAAPEGTTLVATLGGGSVFDVALVHDGERDVVCKRLSPRAAREPAARAAMVREARALALARHAALPALIRVGTDARGPFLIETHVVGVSARGLVEGWRAAVPSRRGSSRTWPRPRRRRSPSSTRSPTTRGRSRFRTGISGPIT